jgi:hypothetical protein
MKYLYLAFTGCNKFLSIAILKTNTTLILILIVHLLFLLLFLLAKMLKWNHTKRLTHFGIWVKINKNKYEINTYKNLIAIDLTFFPVKNRSCFSLVSINIDLA